MKIYLLKAEGEPWSWRQWGLNTQWVDSGRVWGSKWLEGPSISLMNTLGWTCSSWCPHRRPQDRFEEEDLSGAVFSYCLRCSLALGWGQLHIITTPLSSRESRVVTFFSIVFFAVQSWLVTLPRWKPCLPTFSFPPWLHKEGNDGCLDLSSGVSRAPHVCVCAVPETGRGTCRGLRDACS